MAAKLWFRSNFIENFISVTGPSHKLLTGLEINILRQWTTGPPALRIWWSGLKYGGPENYIFHFHLICITEHVQ